ncbi:hypothetical protein P9112_007262 [Eukaryota sp. TZLM1-RC]
MSQESSVLACSPEDMQKFLMCDTHLGAKNLGKGMESYIYTRAPSGHHIINLADTWDKLILAAKIIVAVDNPKDVVIVSSSEYGQRAAHKFARFTGASAIAGRWTPGSLTNYVQKEFIEPRVIVVTDPIQDHQAITEGSYVNIPVIALCNTDTPLRFVDVAVPCNNRSQKSVGFMYWLLCREVLRMRGAIARTAEWEIMPDLFFHRGEAEKEQEELQRLSAEAVHDQPTAMPDAPVVGSEGFALAAPEEFDFGAANTGNWAPDTSAGWGEAPTEQPSAWDEAPTEQPSAWGEAPTEQPSAWGDSSTAWQ